MVYSCVTDWQTLFILCLFVQYIFIFKNVLRQCCPFLPTAEVSVCQSFVNMNYNYCGVELACYLHL